MKNWVLVMSFTINDIFNTFRSYWKKLEINLLGEVIQELCAAIILIIIFAIYKKIKGETLAETINRKMNPKK